MKKDKFNTKFREYASKISPQPNERELISKIYQSFNDLFGINKCIQVGSYPRFTAITPVNDLDILYFLGDWHENNHNPSTVLKAVADKLIAEYENPTNYEVNVKLQSHSVSVIYSDNSNEIFSVDIVPAYIFGKNEFNQDTYKVPEVIRENNHKKREEYYNRLQSEHREMGWISSDPNGYIRVASDIDKLTGGGFRKTVKIVKAWKNNLKKEDQELKLKSFHLEQVITQYFQENQELEIFDAIFKFFVELFVIISRPNQIKDRANNDKFIDDYLEELTWLQKEKITKARDGFLVKLENMNESDTIEELLKIDFFRRPTSEKFLFDSDIKTLTNPTLLLRIDGFVKPLARFSAGWLSKTPQLQKGLTRGPEKKREIEFSVVSNNTSASQYRWKVRNSDKCDEPRGEITLNQTANNPEKTAYIGEHYVECYAIKNNICIAKSRISVRVI